MLNYSEAFKYLDFRTSLVLLIPVTLIAGNLMVNFLLLVISLVFFYDLIINPKLFKKINFIFLIFLILFCIYVTVLSLFSLNVNSSFIRSFSLIRFVILPLFIFFNLSIKSLNKVLLFYLIIILFVGIDNNIQFFTGIDIFGFKAEGYEHDKRIYNLENEIYRVKRLSGPFNDEMISGAFLVKLSFPVLFFLIYNFKVKNNKQKILIFFIIIFAFESTFITGERTSSIIFAALISLLFFHILGFKKTILLSICLLLIIIFFLHFNTYLNSRILDMFNILIDFENSSYGRLITSSYKVWIENIFTGAGLKNYRIDCLQLIDPNPEHPYVYCSTHPHNTFLELLSETGIIGFVLFFSFILNLIHNFKNQFKKNKYKNVKYISLGSLIFISISLVPILPSGSIFSTWNGTLFWLNVGFAMLIFKNKDFKQ